MERRLAVARSSAGGSNGARRRRARAAGALALALVAVCLAGCGATLDDKPSAHVVAATLAPPPVSVSSACSATALSTLSVVLQRIYHEGVESERTASARYLIANSTALRSAVEANDEAGARSALHALLATGHLTDVTIMRGSRTFAKVGGPALAPLQGTLLGADGQPIATYTASVWADNGFLLESEGVTQGLVVLRSGTRSIGGSPSLPASAVADEGTLTHAGVIYRYTSFPAVAYPSGAVRVYALVPLRAIARLCGRTAQETTVNTLERVAELIYEGEMGPTAAAQMRRVERNQAFVQAVARREPEAARLAIDSLLTEHIVRIRVSVGSKLLSDVGGPYVLGPVHAPLRLHGHTIGDVELSIQDDEGYLRLARRLAGLDVLMYMNPDSSHPELVKDSLGPLPGPSLASVPVRGAFRYDGRSYQVFTVHATAFPSGPLTIRVLVPTPYP
ncbi:MAG TPA: hypothetical protein VKV16_09735 [Solirubrobacteraceae bacterium]|nr:hypothetical protein [Solirubrobacteraceae bacterium]